MASVTIERPGVQVIQEFLTTSVTTLVPTMPGCVVGPCIQVIEAVQDDGTLNSDAQLALPARIAFSYVSTPFEYTGIGTDTLSVRVNNAAAEDITFPTGPDLTVDEVADAINTAAVPGLLAAVEVSGATKRVVIYTTASGENASIEVDSSTDADCVTAFGITLGYKNYGASGYSNYWNLRLGIGDYPDPRSNIDEVTIDYDTVRAFIADGSGSFVEATRTQSLLDGATSAVTVQDDGDGDNLSPYLNFASAVFADQAAVLTGSVDLTTLTYGGGGDFDPTFDLIISKNGAAGVTTTLDTSVANAAGVVSAINTAFGATIASLGTGNVLVLTSDVEGVSSSLEVLTGSTAATIVGLAIGDYDAGKPSRARAQGNADLTAVTYASEVQGRVLRMSVDGEQFQTITFSTSVTNASTLVSAINALWGSIASVNGASELVLRSLATFGGRESEIRVDKTASDSTLLTALGLTGSGAPFNSVSVVYGGAFAPVVGDEVWIDGVRVGEITEIPASPTNRLRISSEQLLSYTGATWYILAMGLDNSVATATRPSSDLTVDATSGAVRIKHGLFIETNADVPDVGPLAAYLAYNGLRLDVSPAGSDFNLLRYGLTTDLEAALSPIDTQNPLGLGMYLAILNAPGVEVSGLGVDETSDSAPEGTLDSYTRSFEYLESKDVYSIAPLTHSNSVGAVLQVHVDALSEPENGLERIAILNPSRPTRKADTLVASGATANVSGAPTDTINTGIANLQAKLAAAGVPGPTFTEDDGVFIKLEDDENYYLVQSVSGSSLVINDGPLSASNTLFYDVSGGDVFDAAVVDRPVSVFVLGGSLGSRTDEADAYASIARGYLDRRVLVTAPDTAKSEIDGLETSIEGYYLAAALAGKFSAISASKPLTEESIAGFTGVIGSQDRYSEMQLKILSGGGLWVFQQDGNGPVKTRHQLTSDMSSVEKRESSITRALDFGAKFLRGVIKNFIGRFNLTQNIQDAISLVLEGAAAFLVRLGIFKSLSVSAIRQSATEPDTLEIDCDVEVLYPLNYIRLTLRV